MFKRTGPIASVALMALLSLPLLGSSPAAAAGAVAARVDTSFGGGFANHNLSDLDDQATAVAVQADGAVVVVGQTNTEAFTHTPADIFVARFTAAGRLDPSFGTGGVAVIGAPGQWDLAYAVVVQTDGRIVVGGLVNERPAVLRLTATGHLDPGFGSGGVVPVFEAGHQYVTALALQDDGKILFTGSVFAVGRIEADGELDPSFGTGGVALTPVGWDPNAGTTYNALALQADGRIVVGGSFNGPTWGGPVETASLARYTSAGMPDPTFGAGGFVQTNLDTDYADRGTKITSLAIQPDGRIVAVGQAYEWASQGSPTPGALPTYGPIRRTAMIDVAVFRYLADGSLDPAFAGRGTVLSRITSRTVPSQADSVPGPIGVPDTDTMGVAVALAADGNIVVTGSTNESGRIPLVLRYTAAGLLDTTFGQDGTLVVEMGGASGVPAAAALQPDGNLVIVGSARAGLILPGSYWDVMVGRVILGSGAGTVWTWGWNAMGQLGDGSTVDRHSPVQVPGLTGVVSVSAGAYHTLALRGDGTVWAWGMNSVGQLGDGTGIGRTRPVRVPGLSGVVAVSAGGLHSLALRGDGTVWAWGWNGFGQVGDGTTSMRLSPVRVQTPRGIAAISAVLYHSFAIREDGLALAWGFNAVGQLGEGTTTEQHSPVWLHLMPGNYAVHQLSAGGFHSLEVGVDASFAASGWNGMNQVNTWGGDMHEFGAPLPQVAHAASAGWYHSLLLHTNGSVLASGWNALGQLGDGTTANHGWTAVPGLTGIRAVSAGGLHSLALTDDGHLKAWGCNVAGQLGTGSIVDARTPVLVPSMNDVAVVSAGYLHTAVVRA